MLYFLLRRLVSGIALLFVVATGTFMVMFSTTSDTAINILGQNATSEQIAEKNAQLGLDQPVLSQYWNWLGDAVRGDFGSSWFTPETVTHTLSSRVPVTLSLVVATIVIVALFSVVLGIVAAVHGGATDRFVQMFAIAGYALPAFLVALLLATVFAVQLRWFPATGYVAIEDSLPGWAKTITLPVIALAVGGVASAAQQVRGAMIDVMRQDYMRTLRAGGLSERVVLYKHALRNAAPAGLTVLSLQFVGMLGGTVLVEKIFALPGLGSLTVTSTTLGDLPVVMGVVVVMVAMVVVVYLLIDIANSWLNPKVRLS